MSVPEARASDTNRLLDAVKDVVKLALLFGALVALCCVFNPSEWQHVLRTSVVILPMLAIFRAAERHGREDVSPVLFGGQAVLVVLAGVLLAVVPHRPLADQRNSPFGRLESAHPMLTAAVEDIFLAGICLLIPLAAMSVYVGFWGGGERWRRLAEGYPSLAGFTRGLFLDGTVSLMLWLVFSELVWRLTA